MKATIEFKLKPFQVPNYVLVEERPTAKHEDRIDGIKFHLSELDPATLEKLCDEFRTEVFKKAGKQMPIRAIKG